MAETRPEIGETPRAPAQDAAVRLGLIGKGIQLSRTPAMHMQEGAAQGLALHYDLLDPDEMTGPEPSLSDLLDRAEAAGYGGVNITFPYKKAVIGLVDAVSDAARQVGAVNTVVFRDGKRTGHNTDFRGFAESLRRGLPDARLGTVLLLGAGGAGSAVAHALKALGVEHLLVHDTDRAAAEALAMQAEGAGVADLAQAAVAAQGIVNATPMGMANLPGMAIAPDLIEPRHWVGEIVYLPLETAFLRTARAKGCRSLDGAGMAVFQAVRAFELFTGRKPDVGRMRATFERFAAAAGPRDQSVPP